MKTLTHTDFINIFSIHVKHQLDNSFFKCCKDAAVVNISRIHKVAIVNIAVDYVPDKVSIQKQIVDTVVNLYLKILHVRKVPLWFRSVMQGANMTENCHEKKKPPQRFDPLVLLLTSRRGRLLARFLSRSAALLHQGVYYDSCAPCETDVLSPSASNGWSV